MPRHLRAIITVTLALCHLGVARAEGEVRLEVDARDISRRLLHATLSLPVKAGERTFTFPRWIPGEHSPGGPISGIVGLRMTAGGKTLAWTRDPLDTFAFHVSVPKGVERLEVALDYASPSSGGSFSGSTIGTAHTGVLSWNHVVLIPAGVKSDAVTVRARLLHPAGWQLGTALPVAARQGDAVDFEPVSLTTLIDSPVNMSEHFRRVELPRRSPDEPLHAVDIAAESEAALDAPPELIAGWGRLVAEAGALFGGRHYPRYDFLLTLGDPYGWFGLEHHASSDDRVGERTLVDPQLRLAFAFLLPHELVHSWNGKYRRPAGLATGDYATPMKDDLLWVYEGLTEYLGLVLTARSGLATPDKMREQLGLTFAVQDARAGRSWRPLADTAVGAQDLYVAPSQWRTLRRGTDFYEEGALVWLAVDMELRELSGGKRSLDDFCRAFFGDAGRAAVVPYGFDDVVAALGKVAPFDWRTFFRDRLQSKGPGAPLDGLEASGWRIAFQAEPTEFQAAWDTGGERDLRFSLGLVLASDGQGDIVDVVPGSPAFAAGIGPGMRLAGVDGRRFSNTVLDDALRAASHRAAPIELLVMNGDAYRTVAVDYHGGPRYPTLERIADRPDVLSAILAPRLSATP